MAHKIGGSNVAPHGVQFYCPTGGEYETDGGERLESVEEPAGIGHQTNTVDAMKCPGCVSGYVLFRSGHSGPKAHHFFPSHVN